MKRLQEERERLLAQMEALRNQIVGIDRAISVMEGTEFNHPEERQRARGHNVKNTVLGLVSAAGVSGLSVIQVLDGAKVKGIVLDRGTVSSLLSRLKRENTLDMKDGRYFIRAPVQGENSKVHAIR